MSISQPFATHIRTQVIDGMTVVTSEECRPHGWIRWTVKTTLTEKWAKNIQERLGFAPAGYGFYGFEMNAEKGITTWRCSNNCD